jgi:hypothetical protein
MLYVFNNKMFSFVSFYLNVMADLQPVFGTIYKL